VQDIKRTAGVHSRQQQQQPSYKMGLRWPTSHLGTWETYQEHTLTRIDCRAIPCDLTNPVDYTASKRYQDWILGILANPIFLGENYPDIFFNTTDVNLTALTAEELNYINGTADFFSIDAYTPQYATSPPNGIDACVSNSSDPLWPTCVVNTNVGPDGWLMGQPSLAYSFIAPQYVRQQLGYVWNTYRPKRVLVSE
jgi:hypothetical protein